MKRFSFLTKENSFWMYFMDLEKLCLNISRKKNGIFSKRQFGCEAIGGRSGFASKETILVVDILVPTTVKIHINNQAKSFLSKVSLITSREYLLQQDNEPKGIYNILKSYFETSAFNASDEFQVSTLGNSVGHCGSRNIEKRYTDLKKFFSLIHQV